MISPVLISHFRSSEKWGYLVQFPNPNIKKRLCHKKISYIFWKKLRPITQTLWALWKIFYPFLQKCPFFLKIFSCTLEWLLIKHRINKFLITQYDCWFSQPSKLSKPNRERNKFPIVSWKKVFHTFCASHLAYLNSPTLRKNPSWSSGKTKIVSCN